MRDNLISFVYSRGPPSPSTQTEARRRSDAGLLLYSAPSQLISGQREKVLKALTFGVTRLSEPFENQTRLLASDLCKSHCEPLASERQGSLL